MNIFKKLIRRFEDEMAAAAVAQTGETEMALQILKEPYSDDHHTHSHLSQSNQKVMHLSANPAEGK